MQELNDALIYLLVAVIAVPLSKRLGLGSILGYLLAGVLIGPSAIGLVTDVDSILHFAELGVVFLLFIIGLGIQPIRLWILRRAVFGFGSIQVIVTGLVLSIVAVAIGLKVTTALVCGFGLSLSSTAFVMQLLAERNETATRYGRSAFAVLLFQDLAVIPLLAIIPMLSAGGDSQMNVAAIVKALAAVAALIAGGRYLLRPVLRYVATTNTSELLTAIALLVVIGSAVLMDFVGLSMGLGAFIAGMLLADSEYRHELEINIEPFKGLLLGLFFIAVGMSMKLSLLATQPLQIASIVVALILIKALIIYVGARFFGHTSREKLRMSLILSQGGEFGFVIFTQAMLTGVIDQDTASVLILAISLSMALTPLLLIIADRYLARLDKSENERVFDTFDDHPNEIIIASFGRFGQIVGRVLRSKNIPFTALESNPAQVDVVRRFGNKVYFGDARRIDLLRAAGAAKARFFILAIEDIERSVETAKLVRAHFPHLKILARARNRLHAHRLMEAGIENPVRDTIQSSLLLTENLLTALGYEDGEAKHITRTFFEHDEQVLRRQQSYHFDEKRMIQTAREAADELETLLRTDREQKPLDE